jgi:hypothetical protein
MVADHLDLCRRLLDLTPAKPQTLLRAVDERISCTTVPLVPGDPRAAAGGAVDNEKRKRSHGR